MQVCASCGHHNRPGILFCENCGTSLTGQAAAGSTRGLDDDLEVGASEPITSAGTDFLAPGSTLRIEIEGGPEPVLVKPKQELIFGRRDPATGAMPDIDLTPYAGYRMGVSRRHAALRASENNRMDVWDLGSSNGTFLNGVRLNPHRPYRLRDGDRIRLGQMVIRVLFQPGNGQEKPEAQAAAVPASTALSDMNNLPETRTAEELEESIRQALERDMTAPVSPEEIESVITDMIGADIAAELASQEAARHDADSPAESAPEPGPDAADSPADAPAPKSGER